MEMTRFIEQFVQVAAGDDLKTKFKLRQLIANSEKNHELDVKQFATVIRLNLIMHQMRARRDRSGMVIQTIRVTKARRHLERHIDASVEDLTELLWLENSTHPQAAQVNNDFLAWATRTRTARTLNLRESA